MTSLALAVLIIFFVASAVITVRMHGMSDAELRRRLGDTERKLGFLSALGRAPLAWLISNGVGALTAVLVWVTNPSSPNVVRTAALLAGVGWILATGVALNASFRGRPRWLVHRSLRDED